MADHCPMGEVLLAQSIESPVVGNAEAVVLRLDAQPDDEPSASLESRRRIELLRADTGAAVAALLVLDGSRVLIRTLATEAGIIECDVDMPIWQPGSATVESRASVLLSAANATVSATGDPAYAETPVLVDGDLFGWTAVAAQPGRHWSEQDLRTLADAAALASADEKLRSAISEAARVRDLIGSSNRVHELIAQDAPLVDVLNELVEGVERYDSSVIACVVFLDRESSTLHPGAAPSLPAHYLAAIDGVVIGPNIGTCGSAAWSGDLTITDDIAEDPKWAPVRDFAVGCGLRHCWSMPIKASNGDVLGTFALYGSQPRRPLPDHLSLMQDGARLAGIAIERNFTMQKLIHDAHHDGLTGLANRASIFAHLDEALAHLGPASKVAVLFVDLDGLKTLNDTLGHDHADEMIRKTADRLAATARSGDFVGRLGGDEFVVIAPGIVDREQASQLAFRLLDAISDPISQIEPTVVTASIGITLIGDRGTDASEAIRQADNAMYEAKRAGRDQCSFFEGSQPVRLGRRQSIARELRDAETRGEMSLVFQPVFDLASSEVVAFEALARWHSKRLGDVSPADFIPIAENTGTILPIGAWVLRESCETLARLAQQIQQPPELAVNVSGHQLARPGFAQSVYQTLRHAEIPAHLLTLEITETALMPANATSTRTLSELAALGVQIVLDDFGTGYSSLSSLKEHPIRGIKIDRNFITELADSDADRAIVAAVIGLARARGCAVTAEGVETDAQLDALKKLGCDRVQGFLLARPMPEDQLLALLG
jgi:diguanylate cyclase (GGDEF)-like protein